MKNLTRTTSTPSNKMNSKDDPGPAHIRWNDNKDEYGMEDDWIPDMSYEEISKIYKMPNFTTYSSYLERSEINSFAIKADKIRDVYLNRMSELSDMKKQHFLSRLSKVYGNHWDIQINEIAYSLAKEVEDLFEEYSNGEYQRAIDNFIELRTKDAAKLDSKDRGNEWIKSNEERTKKFLAYLELLTKTNIVMRLKSEYSFNVKKLKEIRNWLMQNWDEQIDFVIENPESFRMIPVQAINVFYYMESLKWINSDYVNEREEKFIKSLRKSYEGTLSDPIEFNNYLYALTHIIIGKSWFYEYKLPTYRGKYGWIIDFFFTHENRLMKECIEDIVIEIGVVLHICNETSRTINYKKYTINKLNRDGIIPNEEDSLSVGEHSNILAIMLLREF